MAASRRPVSGLALTEGLISTGDVRAALWVRRARAFASVVSVALMPLLHLSLAPDLLVDITVGTLHGESSDFRQMTQGPPAWHPGQNATAELLGRRAHSRT
jgi:hypothetical protein